MARQQKAAKVEERSSATPANPLFDRVTEYLDVKEWNFTAEKEKSVFFTGCRIKDASVRVIIDVYQEEAWQRVSVYSVFPVFVPELRRAAVSECLSRINYKLMFGNLEMDLNDGEIRVRTIVESDGQLGDAMLDRVLNANLDSANIYFAPIFAVAFGNAAPESVLNLLTKDEGATLQ